MATLPSNRQPGWRFFPVLLLGAALAAHAQPAPQSVSAAALAARIDHHYNSLRSLEVQFVQTYDGMGIHKREAGALLLKKPGRMVWTYTDPDGKLYVLDGKNGYFYSPGDSEAQRVPAKKLDDLQSPLRFLLGHTELEKELDDLRLSSQANGEYTLAGVPKGMAERVASLSLTTSPDGIIRVMRITETDGVVNTFDFSGEADNVPAPDSAFVFHPPSGVHIIQGMSPM
jgi:outer membrane lipoprotein carrier protein